MQEPISAAVTASAVGFSVTGLLAGFDAGVLVGAFTGAVVFVIFAVDSRTEHKWLLLLSSIVVGVLFAQSVADLLTMQLGVAVDKAVGAVLSSAVIVGALIAFAKSGSLTDFVSRVISNAIDKLGGKK